MSVQGAARQPPAMGLADPTSHMTSKRRRFQSTIPSYFPNASTTNPHCDISSTNPPLTYFHYSAETSSPVPALTDEDQSRLRTAPMRARKSIADGYRTEISLKAERKMYSYGNPVLYDGSSGGGQVITTEEGDRFSLPASSQESNGSSTIDTNKGQKRSYDPSGDEGEDDFQANQMQLSAHHSSSTRSVPPARHTLHPNVDRQRRRFFSPSGVQQNDMDTSSDFENASFLRNKEEVDPDYFVRGGNDQHESAMYE